jgi:hypothetical protein
VNPDKISDLFPTPGRDKSGGKVFGDASLRSKSGNLRRAAARR